MAIKHEVTSNDNCYFCKKCGKAAGDGDGLIGAICYGRLYRLLQAFSITAPKQSRAATFTPDQFMKILTNEEKE